MINNITSLINQRYGRWTVIGDYITFKNSSNKNERKWLCRCDCGNEIDVSYNELVYTHLQSCGCKKEEYNEMLQNFLTHIDGTSLDMLKSKKIWTNNTTGAKGVYLIRGKYVAKIVFQKNPIISAHIKPLKRLLKYKKMLKKRCEERFVIIIFNGANKLRLILIGQYKIR